MMNDMKNVSLRFAALMAAMTMTMIAAVIYGIRELSTANPARRTFIIDLVWKFNEARSKYRGSGAGEKQKARM